MKRDTPDSTKHEYSNALHVSTRHHLQLHRDMSPHRHDLAVLLTAAVALLFSALPLHAQGGAQPEPSGEVVAATASPTRPPRQSWTSPRRAFTVGDVVTVLIDEYTLASANTGNSASDNRRRDMGLDGGFSSGATGTNMRGGISSSNRSESVQRGEAVRQNRFQSEMSVRIVALDSATGLLQLEGSKLVDVDRNRQEVTFTGWVRPQDVSAQNQVESWRVADAQLLYTAKGDLGKPKGGILGRIFGMIWP